MRLPTALVMRATLILLLAATLFAALALPGAGARVISVPKGGRSSLPPRTKSLQQSTADGRIAFEQNGDIYLINPDGTGLTQLIHSSHGISYYQPALSPD